MEAAREKLETLARAFTAQLLSQRAISTPPLVFPSRSVSRIRKTAQILKVIEIVHASLLSGTSLTKRAVFYTAPALFGTQAVSDRILASLELDEEAVVLASPRGLFYGPVTIDGVRMTEGSVPSQAQVHTDARWLLIVEKEATLRALCRSPVVSGGLVVTAKGYPDMATCRFITQLNPDLRTYILVDGDPYGLDILRTYASAIPRHLEWIGMRPEQFQAHHFVQLRLDERKKALSLLRIPLARAAATRLLLLGYKVEIPTGSDLITLLHNTLDGEDRSR